MIGAVLEEQPPRGSGFESFPAGALISSRAVLWDLLEDLLAPPVDPDLPEIVLLAGFLGLHLARPDGTRVWLTPERFAFADVASDLRFDQQLVPDGVNGLIYGDLVRGLRAQGFAVRAFRFDSRKSALAIAEDLAASLAAAGAGRRFVLVGHSMGALIAALYPYVDPSWHERIERAIFLGGVLGGTFESVECALATHPIITRLSGLSLQNGPEGFASCMRTWPGLFDMLPDPALFEHGERAFDASRWPRDRAPAPELLARSRKARELVNTSPIFQIPCTQLASVRFSTTDRYLDDGVTPGPRDAAGDGSLPARLATFGGVPAHEIDLPHTLIPLDPKAIGAIVDLVKTGRTRLPEITRAQREARLVGEPQGLEEMVALYLGAALGRFGEGAAALLPLCPLFCPPR